MLQEHISWSEMRAWMTCRKQWFWAYSIRIEPIRVSRAIRFGSCGHVAMAAALRQEDWRAAIDLWIEKANTSEPMMFDEDKADNVQIGEEAKDVIERYLHYVELPEAVVVEQRFSVPISGIRTRLIGYWDAIVRDKAGKLWLLEHKFPKQYIQSAEDLELNGQIGTYLWAARRCGYDVQGTIFNQVLAKTPTLPKVNKDGSISRVKSIMCDWPTYRQFVIDHGQDPNDYGDMQLALQGVAFWAIERHYRGEQEISNYGEELKRRVWDIVRKKKHIYRSESMINCRMCMYRDLCLEEIKGGDVDWFLENAFRPKTNHHQEEATIEDGEAG